MEEETYIGSGRVMVIVIDDKLTIMTDCPKCGRLLQKKEYIAIVTCFCGYVWQEW
jgi:hypothetical protein